MPLNKQWVYNAKTEVHQVPDNVKEKTWKDLEKIEFRVPKIGVGDSWD